MADFPEILKFAKKWLCVPLIIIMAWQQWLTFLNHEKQFVNPIHFIKENYGNDYITQYGKRYEEIKKIFSKPVHLSYFGEADEDYYNSAMHYALTRYYLTPNLISRNNLVCDTIIYNLYSSIHINPQSNFHLNNGWHIVKDFNNGLIILAK